MNDSLKKPKPTLENPLGESKVIEGKDPIELIKAKKPKNEVLKQAYTDLASRQAARDWWWCDDV